MSIETRGAGRELMVQYTCRRCGCKAVLPYDEVMTGEHYGYLHNSKLPERWHELPGHVLLCEGCFEKYKAFMNPAQEAREA